MLDLKSFSDDRLVDWMRGFVDKLKAHASDLGLGSHEVDSVDHDYRAMSGLVTEEKRVQQSNADPQIKREFTEYKDLIKSGPSDDLKAQFPSVFTATATKAAPGIIPRLQQFVESLMQRTGFSPDMAERLGITGLGAGAAMNAMRDQGQFTNWFGNFIGGVKEKQSELNVSDSEMKSLESDYQASHHLVNSTRMAEQQGTSSSMLEKLTSYKDMIVNGPSDGLKSAFPGILGMLAAAAPGILPRVTGLIDQLKGNPKFDQLVGKDVGISDVAGTAAGRARETVGAGTAAVAGGGERATSAAGRGAGYGAGTERGPSGNGGKWILPVLALVALGLLAWAAFRDSGERMRARAPETPRTTTPAAPGAGPAKEKTGVSAPLTISDLRFEPGAKGGRLLWKTNRPATSQIQLGKTDSYEMGLAPKNVSRTRESLVADHQVGLTGLSSGAKYYVRARSQDQAGKEAVSQPYSFTVP